jgi:serine/threonine-protein kinase
MQQGIGSVLNEKYLLERELGRGALGSVYAGTNLSTKRACAIRVLPEAAAELTVERERFLRDHKVVAQIADSRLPAALDVAMTEAGRLFLITELWRGETLRQRLRRGALPMRAGLALIEGLCQILGEAHRRGVTHGDVRPENIVLGRAERVQLTDLGLHHFRIGPLRVSPKRAPGAGLYTPPEMLESKTREADPTGDVFALGAILYEILAGRPAFPDPPAVGKGLSARSGLAHLLRGGQRPGKTAGEAATEEMLAALCTLLERACAPESKDRFPDAAALGQELASLSAPQEQDGPRTEPGGEAMGEARSEDRTDESAARRSKRPPLHTGSPPASPPQAEPSADGTPGEPTAQPPPSGPPPLPLALALAAQTPLSAPPVPSQATLRPSSAPEERPLSPVEARLQAIRRGEFRPSASTPTAHKADPPPRRILSGPAAPVSRPGASGPSSRPGSAPGPSPAQAADPRQVDEAAPIEPTPPPAPSGRTPRPSLSAVIPPAEDKDKEEKEPAQAAPEAPTPRAQTAPPEPEQAPTPERAPASPVMPAPAAVKTPSGVTPLPEPDEKAAEAARAIAAARAAASARLLEAAKQRARQAVPEAVPLTTSRGNSARRRAPANLQEQPPAAGEVIATIRPAPTLEEAQIIVDLPEARPTQRPPGAPPPLPPGAARVSGALPVLPQPEVFDGDKRPRAVASRASLLPTVRTAPVAGGVKETEEVEATLRPRPSGLRTLRGVALVSLTLVLLTLVVARLLPSQHAQEKPPVSAAPPQENIGLLLGEVDRALDVQDWRTAVLRADHALRAHPGHLAAQEKRRRAEAEMENQFRYESFRGAVERKNNEAAMALYAEIPDSSVYKEKAREQAQRVRGEYIAAKLVEARAARRLGLCAEVKRLAQAVLSLDSTQEEALALESKCGEEPRAPAASPSPAPSAAPGEGEPKRPRRQAPEKKPAQPEDGVPSIKELRDPFARK